VQIIRNGNVSVPRLLADTAKIQEIAALVLHTGNYKIHDILQDKNDMGK